MLELVNWHFSIYLEFQDIALYNLSVYHNNLHDKQNCIITGSPGCSQSIEGRRRWHDHVFTAQLVSRYTAIISGSGGCPVWATWTKSRKEIEITNH